jgi:hypothetical protein
LYCVMFNGYEAHHGSRSAEASIKPLSAPNRRHDNDVAFPLDAEAGEEVVADR